MFNKLVVIMVLTLVMSTPFQVLGKEITSQEVLSEMEIIKKKMTEQKKLSSRLQLLASFKRTITTWQKRLPFGNKNDQIKMSIYMLDETLQYIKTPGFTCEKRADVHHDILFGVFPAGHGLEISLPGEVKFALDVLKILCSK